MTTADDNIDQQAQETDSVANKVDDTELDAAENVVDNTRELAQELFDKIKAAREKTAKRID